LTTTTLRWEDISSVKQVKSALSDDLEIRRHDGEIHIISLRHLNQPSEQIATTAIDLHRRSSGRGTLAAELHQAGIAIPCPACGQDSDSVKCYEYISMMFAIVAYGYSTNPKTGCPACTRKFIGKNLLVNLPTANLVWPVICVPWAIALLLASFTRGHSKSILKSLASGIVSRGHESCQ
ncbi:MAG: hypothetical protein R3C49_22100, partial [Planctomycetaceae bacterium]